MRAVYLLLLGAAFPAMAAESTFPASFDGGRYASMMKNSPFVLATVQEKPAEPQHSFAENWKVTGLAKLPDADGVKHDYVTVRSQDQRVVFSLYGDEVSKEPDAEGVSLDHVEWNVATPRKSKVFLKKGSEVASVEFGEDLAPTAAPAQAAPGRGGNPAVPPVVRLPNSIGTPGNRIAPPNVVQRPPGNPLSRPMLPRPGASLPLPGMPTPNNQMRPAGPGIQQPPAQKRIRVIPSLQQ